VSATGFAVRVARALVSEPDLVAVLFPVPVRAMRRRLVA